jgi:SulP family sulfate permease
MSVGMVVGSLVALVLNHILGAANTGIASIGALRIGLPPFSQPDLSLEALRQMAPIAAAVALLALTEAVSIARAMALKSGQRIDGNQEFVGQGLSNLAGSFFSGYASSGSFNRTGLNYASGAKTPLAAVFSAFFLLGILLFLAPLAKYLPIPAMAGILFVVAWGLFDFHHAGEIMRASRRETFVLLATFVATLTIELEFAIYIGVALSFLFYVHRTSRPGLEDLKPLPGQNPPAFSALTGLPDCPQLKILRINGSIYFGAVNHLAQAMQQLDEQNPQQRHVLLVASGINFVDMAGAQWLVQEAKRRRALGGDLFFFHMKEEPLNTLRECGAYADLGADHFFTLGDDLMGQVLRHLQPSVCATCKLRVFANCQGQPGAV